MGELEAEIRPLDLRLEPIANGLVDLEDPDWEEKLDALEPLDEAGIRRDEAERLFLRIIEHYDHASEETRRGIRDLFKRYRSFAWVVYMPNKPLGEETFRQHLLLFSIDDQGQDPRDAILWLEGLCGRAAEVGVDIGPILKEVAAMSSNRNRYGMGSTRSLLKGAVQKVTASTRRSRKGGRKR